MDDYTLWLLARVLGLTSFATLAISVASGVALRTSVLDVLATNRTLRRLHDFSTPLWLPLGAGHIIALLGDKTARIAIVDVVVPFQTSYGQLAIGLGTVSLDLIAIVVLTSWVKRWMHQGLWRWIHRASYVAFAALFLHSVQAGTDFDAPLVSAVAWSIAALVGVLGVSRVAFGRLPA